MHVVRRNLLDHWREFYSNTLHCAPAAACRDRDPASTSAVPDDNISSDQYLFWSSYTERDKQGNPATEKIEKRQD